MSQSLPMRNSDFSEPWGKPLQFPLQAYDKNHSGLNAFHSVGGKEGEKGRSALKTHFPELTIISVHFTSDSQMKNIHSFVKMNSGEVH